MEKFNCWQFAKCGCHEGGDNVDEKGVCPASIAEQLDGKNKGVNGGRTCWVVSGTLCDKKVHEDFVNKLGRCKKCQFYAKVHEEEGEDIEPLLALFACLVDMDGDIR